VLDQISEKVNKEHFDKHSAEYDERFGLSLEITRGRARFIREHTKYPAAVGNALDLGCGTGNLTIALVLENMTVNSIGLDISPGMLSVAKGKIRNEPACEFMAGSALKLPFKERTFDLCVGDAFLHHILDVEACLAEVYRVLKHGGMATFNEPSRDGYAFFEFIIRMILDATDSKDQALENYIDFLAFEREHEGDLKALKAYPLPDKHVFSEKALKQIAKSTGFSEIVFEPAMDPWTMLWQHSFNAVLTELNATEDMTKKLLRAAELVDEIMGDASRQHFCLHNQMFLYKKATP